MANILYTIGYTCALRQIQRKRKGRSTSLEEEQRALEEEGQANAKDPVLRQSQGSSRNPSRLHHFCKLVLLSKCLPTPHFTVFLLCIADTQQIQQAGNFSVLCSAAFFLLSHDTAIDLPLPVLSS